MAKAAHSPSACELIDALLSQSLDPGPVRFRALDERGVPVVRALFREEEGNLVPLRRLLNRNAFLCGCLDATEHEAIEHLIVGIGRMYGNTTRVAVAARASGDADSVSIPQSLSNAIVRAVGSEHAAEAIVFHNHPRNIFNLLIDNVPIASCADRDVLTRTLLSVTGLKRLLGGGSVRFYIGENGYVREFRLPSVLVMIRALDALQCAMSQTTAPVRE